MNNHFNAAARFLTAWRDEEQLFPMAGRSLIARAIRSVPHSQRRYVRFKLRMICEFPNKVAR